MQNIRGIKSDIKKCIKNANQVFITMHKRADLDAMASALATAIIVKKFNKPVYIILDDIDIEPGVKKILEKENINFSFINTKHYLNLKSNNDLLICVDTNKHNLLSLNEYIENFKEIFIIDHHNTDNLTLKTNHSYIDTTSFSASEILTELLLSLGIKIDANIATYLLSGIYLDTNKLTCDKMTSSTWKVIYKLINLGASTKGVNEYFVRDFESDKKVRSLINKTQIIHNGNETYAISIDRDKNIYKKEELSKVANELIRYNFDVGFAIGFTSENDLSISARSKGDIDVSEIMRIFGGGGTVSAAAAKISKKDIEDIELKLLKKVKYKY